MRGRRPSTYDADKARRHDRPGGHSGNKTKSLKFDKDAVNHAKLSADMVKPSTWMSKSQAENFCFMRDSIVLLDIAAVSDRYSLELLCLQYAQFIDLTDTINTDGYMVAVEGKDGQLTTKPHPLLGEKGRTYTALKQMLTEYGMTPNSRRAVLKRDPNAAEGTEEQDWDDLLN